MSAIQINKSHDSGYQVYRFEANHTRYEVLTLNGKEFQVYSARKSLSQRNPPKVYDSLEELAKRSRAFRNFAKLIAPEFGQLIH